MNYDPVIVWFPEAPDELESEGACQSRGGVSDHRGRVRSKGCVRAEGVGHFI